MQVGAHQNVAAYAGHPVGCRWANGQLAFGLYAGHDKTQTFVRRAGDVPTLRGAPIEAITAFLTPAEANVSL